MCLFSVCDSCVIVLLEDLDKMEENFRSVSAQLSSLNASSVAWTQLYGLNRSLEDAAVSITHTHRQYAVAAQTVVLNALILP